MLKAQVSCFIQCIVLLNGSHLIMGICVAVLNVAACSHGLAGPALCW